MIRRKSGIVRELEYWKRILKLIRQTLLFLTVHIYLYGSLVIFTSQLYCKQKKLTSIKIVGNPVKFTKLENAYDMCSYKLKEEASCDIKLQNLSCPL